MASMARSSCTAGERLGMATLHLLAQTLERAELKLFDGAFGFLQPPGDFSDAALLDKAFAYDLALNSGKVIDKSEKTGVVVDSFRVGRGEVRMVVWVLFIVRGRLLAGGAFVLISESVGGYAEEPCGERGAAPFVGGKICESFVKDL